MCTNIFGKIIFCALHVFLCALVLRPVWARTCTQLRGNIDYDPDASSISTRVIYGLAIYAGLVLSRSNQLQSVLNAAACLIGCIPKFAHLCSFIQKELHWLLMQTCIKFKILMNIHNYLACQATVYLRELHVTVLSIRGHRFLCSATQSILVVPKAKTFKVLHKSFAVVNPSSGIGCLATSVINCFVCCCPVSTNAWKPFFPLWFCVTKEFLGKLRYINLWLWFA